HGVRGMEDILRNPIYATGLGLLQYAKHDRGAQQQPVSGTDEIEIPLRINMLHRVKHWIQSNF
ncbi:cell division protein FtsA, partial [Pontibacter sp. JAM-7]